MTAQHPGTDRQPALDRPRFVCPTCDAYAHQDWTDIVSPEPDGDWSYLERQRVLPDADDADPFGSPPPSLMTQSLWRAARCASCGRWSIWYRRQMVYPHGRVGAPPHPDMPAEVRELYQEAASVAVVSRRAGAAMARTTVERLIKVLDASAPSKANLEARIAWLKPQVSTHLGQMLDVVRVTGNGAVHAADQLGELVVMVLDDEQGPPLLELLLETANDLVDELITRPKTTNDLWEKLPAGVKAKLQAATSAATGDE